MPNSASQRNKDSRVNWIAIATSVGGLLISAASLVVSAAGYNVAAATKQAQDIDSERAYANKVVQVVYGPNQRLVQNYGSLPILDVRLIIQVGNAVADQNPDNTIVHLGTMAPCTQIRTTEIEQSLTKEQSSDKTIHIQYTDINLQTWDRTAGGPPLKVSFQELQHQLAPDAGLNIRAEPLPACPSG